MISRPIVTLTSDFGTRDAYVAAMKAAVLRHSAQATLVDVTHEVPRHDILAGSFTLERAVAAFPAGTVHVAVVDPGVGTTRRILICHVHDQWVVLPDNGLITWPWRRFPGGECFELTWKPDLPTSATFHGRDIMAPVAGMLAAGVPIEALARAAAGPVLLDVAPTDGPRGRIIHVDHFGNLTTNLLAVALDHFTGHVIAGGHNLGPVRRTYQDVKFGEALALIGSAALLEIAVCEGSAVEQLKLNVGDEVVLQ